MHAASKKTPKLDEPAQAMALATAALRRGDARQATLQLRAVQAAHAEFAAAAQAALARLRIDRAAVLVGLGASLLYLVAWLVVL
ncbi:MAG: hypothetical protein EOO40_07915 [Deltaproteobacteria bacterium]|nr:MAG: hypothetical protein EOO40_07915 [Deltaproteobacteria bacterium]